MRDINNTNDVGSADKTRLRSRPTASAKNSKTEYAADWQESQRQLAALEIQAGLLDASPSCQRVWFEFRITHLRPQVADALAILIRRRLTILHFAELSKMHGTKSLVLRLRPVRYRVSLSCEPDAEDAQGASETLGAYGPESIRNTIVVRFAKGTYRRWPVKIRPSTRSADLP